MRTRVRHFDPNFWQCVTCISPLLQEQALTEKDDINITINDDNLGIIVDLLSEQIFFGKNSLILTLFDLGTSHYPNIHTYIIDQARGQDGWILAEFSFCVFMDQDEVEVHKNAKRELGQYPAILTKLAWSIKDLLHGIKSIEKMILILVYFRALKRKPVICKSDNALRFSCFLVPSRQRSHRKSCYYHGKYFAKENFCAPACTSAKCYCGNKTGNPERAVSLYLARSGSQSQRGIWFILPACRACHNK